MGTVERPAALFYWSALRAGYRLTEYVSISEIVLKAPAKYAHAFLHTETDSNDLTYFLIHQLEVLRRAFEELAIHVDETIERMQAAERLAGDLTGLNHRQRALLGHALRHPGYRYTYRSHGTSHGVVLQTARTDLLALASHGLLDGGNGGSEESVHLSRRPWSTAQGQRQNTDHPTRPLTSNLEDIRSKLYSCARA